jgi:hypothetical protein
MTLRTYPLTLRQANDYVAKLHRHHDKCTSHRFSFAAVKGGWVGVVIVGRPVSFVYDPYLVCEVSRLCTIGERNACSFLYGAAARIAREMGFYRIQTYTLDVETGESLRAAGWTHGGLRESKPWSQREDGRKRHNKHPTGPKHLWFREFGTPPRAPAFPTLDAMLA